MKNKEVKGILALALVTALSFGVILGSRALSQEMPGAKAGAGETAGAITEEFDVSGAENIDKAGKIDGGYLVTVREPGYGGDVVMDVTFDETGETVTNVAITEHAETEGLGAKIAEADFLGQFTDAKAPVYLPGMSASLESGSNETPEGESSNETLDILESVPLTDGTYEAKTDAPDESGFIDQLTLTVEGGKITQVNWDCLTEDGQKKSVMSENGEYTMTEDGLTWKEQSEALAAALVENQSLKFFTTDQAGKTDAVSGVSISIGGFLSLAQDCLEQAAGIAVADPLAGASLADGTYEAKTDAPDESGFIDQLTLTVEGGKITQVNWDCLTEDGQKKSVMSENGEYTMTEDGLTWKEQSEALAAALVENQSLSFFSTDEAGKTDAVSGVSISIGGFLSLAEECLAQAAGTELPQEPEATNAPTQEEAPAEGTQVNAVSGATVSSTAAVNGINDAYAFLQTVK